MAEVLINKDTMITVEKEPSLEELQKTERENDTLKGGYYLLHKFEQDGKYIDQNLYLMKGNKTIKLLNSMGYAANGGYLGYVEADFNDCFVFATHTGGGNPIEIQLVKKSTGEIMKESYFIDADEKEEILIHYDLPNIFVYDIKHNKEWTIDDPNVPCIILSDCIEILDAGKNKISLQFITDNDTIVKKYMRR